MTPVAAVAASSKDSLTTASVSPLPRIVYTAPALADLQRLRAFLAGKSEPAASRAKGAISGAIKSLPRAPEANRPVPDLPSCFDLIIPFGASGYIARYRYLRGQPIFILAIRHQLETGWEVGDEA